MRSTHKKIFVDNVDKYLLTIHIDGVLNIYIGMLLRVSTDCIKVFIFLGLLRPTVFPFYIVL